MPPRPNWMRNSWRIVLPCWSKKKRRCGRVQCVIFGCAWQSCRFFICFFSNLTFSSVRFCCFLCDMLLWSSCTYQLVVLLTNVYQAWKKIEECGNLVAENMAKMRTSKYKVGLPLLLLVINGVISYNSTYVNQKPRWNPYLFGHF